MSRPWIWFWWAVELGIIAAVLCTDPAGWGAGDTQRALGVAFGFVIGALKFRRQSGPTGPPTPPVSTVPRKPYKEEYLQAARVRGRRMVTPEWTGETVSTRDPYLRHCCLSYPGQEHWDNCPSKGTR